MNIFIDTEDMEERYGEELYKDYLEKQVNDYKSRIEKAVEYIEPKMINEYLHTDYIYKMLNILRGEDK